jgi:hypothetical protein
MRYFRQAQVSTDVFDAFRNLYLALEAILSTIAPPGPGEPEGGWLKRALGEARKLVDLAQFSSLGGVQDVVKELHDELYVKVRTAVFHAKIGRPVLLPLDRAGRAVVAKALERLDGLYLALLEQVVGVRFGRSGATKYAFDAMVRGVGLERLYLTDDETPVDASAERVEVPNGKTLVGVPLVRTPELDDDWLAMYTTETPVGVLKAHMPYVAKLIAATNENGPGLLFTLEERLDLEGFARLEVAVGFRLVNRGPKIRYLT